jgi:predicted nucleotidyltransferase
MRPTVGIISEYDPFHSGHARQFALVRQALPDARIVCVMSGCFTQRGMPALFSPAFRAQAALRAGADAVLELPCAFAVREAENFALGGVSLLNALGFITHLSFGLEANAQPQLQAAAALLEAPDIIFTLALHASLAKGMPFVKAQADATAAALAVRGDAGASPDTIKRLLSQPNNILGVCYLRALMRLHSPIEPLPVIREGGYHEKTLDADGYPSASAVRGAFLAGDLSAAENACGYPLADEPCHRPDALDAALLYQLRRMGAAELRTLPDCSEGLEGRVQKAAHLAVSRTDLLSRLKTRRYAYARLNRLATHALLGVTADLLNAHPVPEYTRLLGFREDSRDILTGFKQSRIPVIAKAADGDAHNPLFALDERAYDLWALGAGLPAGMMYRNKMIKI